MFTQGSRIQVPDHRGAGSRRAVLEGLRAGLGTWLRNICSRAGPIRHEGGKGLGEFRSFWLYYQDVGVRGFEVSALPSLI